jgi:hypothetical protein
MFIIAAITAVALAAMLLLSASLKLRQHDMSVSIINGVVGVPLRLFPALAGLEIAGAAGVVAGLWLAPLGIAAAVGVVLYFVGAIAAHVRVGDVKGSANPLVILALAVIVLVLRLATA